MKRGQKRGELLERVKAALKAAGKKGISTAELAEQADCNRQYVRLLLRGTLASKVKREGVSSPTSAPVYRWKK